MPPAEVGAAYVAIRAIATGFREQASQEVNSALASVREQATVPIRAQVDTTAANRVQQSFQPVVAGARQMGSEVEKSYGTIGSSSHRAYERVTVDHGGIRARFGETLRAASAMGGGIALAYGAFSQTRQALTATNELAHATHVLSETTGLDARQASAWVAIAQARGVESTSLQTSFNALARVTSSATDSFRTSTGALSTYGKAFHDLGITQSALMQVQGNMPAQLNLISDGFARLGPGVDRTRIAQQLFGRGYAALLPILADGSKGLQDNIDTATQYGATLSGPTMRGLQQLRGEQNKLNLEMLGLRVRIATVLEPVLIDLGLKAVTVASQFGNVLSGGIRIARGALDTFLQTPYGKGLDTIAGDAVRFADQVRTRFERTLSRPLSFSRLFDNFTRDLTTWLPHAAGDFWRQLNQDLFAQGDRAANPVHVRIMYHATGQQAPATGAGLFPGMDWPSIGRELGQKVADGIVVGLKGLISHGGQVIAVMQTLLGDVVNWIVNGGGAAMILSGALEVANAFVGVVFDPKFWIDNWRPILGLAFIFFSDGFGELAKGIIGRLSEMFGPRLAAVVTHYLPITVKEFIDAFRALPEAIGVQILRIGDFISGRLPGLLAEANDAIFRWASDLPRMLITAAADVPHAIRGLFAGIREFLGQALDVGLIGNLILRILEGITKISVLGTMKDFAFNILRGIGAGLLSGAGWLQNQVTSLFHRFIRWAEGVLGISSPSSVAAGWGRDIVLGLVRGLASLPGRLLGLWEEGVRVEIRIAGRMISEARRLGSGILHGVISEVSRLPGQATALLGRLAESFVSSYAHLGRVAAALGLRIVNGVISEARRVPGQVRAQIERVGQLITGLQAWLIREGVKIGSAILNGVISGVKSLPGKLGGALKDAAGGALSDVAGWAGIGSPSRRFQDEIGAPINDGIVKGLDPLRGDMRTAIIPVMNRVLSDAHDQGRANGRGVGAGITTGIGAGLNPLQGSMAHAIISASNGAMAQAKRALGIHSPSSVYAEQIGKPLAEGIVHGMGGLEQALAARITKAAQAATAATGNVGGSSTPGGTAAVGANQALGQRMMLAAGWPASQWGALQALWTRESGWNQYAKNASSGAYGIPQSLPASKMASAGADYLTNAATQIRWGLDYIRARYGSPGGAWAHEGQYGWYGGGGVVPGPVGQPQAAVVHGGEVVFTPEQMRLLGGGRGVNVEQLVIVEPRDGRAAADDFLNEIANRAR